MYHTVSILDGIMEIAIVCHMYSRHNMGGCAVISVGSIIPLPFMVTRHLFNAFIRFSC